MIHDKSSDCATQPLSRGEIKAKMDARENAAQRRLFGCGRKTPERALDPR
jgi:hypothetical protein